LTSSIFICYILSSDKHSRGADFMVKERSSAVPRPNTEETRRAILRAAHTLFMELGYRRVTTRMVAEACGVKQPLLYYHFADKETLYLAVHQEQIASSRAALERIAARHHESIPERLHAVVCYLRRSSPHNMGMFFHELKYEMSPSMRASLRELFTTGIVAPILSIFEEGIQSGFLRSPDVGGISPHFSTYLLLSAVSSLPGSSELEGIQNFNALERKEHDPVDEIVHALLYGMAAQPD
jgi:AcrR family transcriptional regulator